MATSRTLQFLPEIFQTDTNSKFLSATLDQLVSEPNLVRIDGYVGRKFAPTFQFKDNYILESTADRTSYQLEPSLITKAVNGTIDHYSGYTDLINKLKYYGAETTNHDRLFQSEMYTYNGLFDFDKFINYSQYYWLPNGIDPVVITSTVVNSQQTFILTTDTNTKLINIQNQLEHNPALTLVRGGLYKFYTNRPGAKIWIQTEPGVSGFKRAQPVISTRDILGVSNNGTDHGTIEFSVPLDTAQDNFLKMPILASVNYATTQLIDDVRGHRLSELPNGIDGSITNPNYKTVIFLSSNDTTIYKIQLVVNGEDTDFIQLEVVCTIPVDTRVYVRSGETNIGTEFYNNAGQLEQIPPLTSNFDRLYYQDESNPDAYGTIDLVNNAVESIDVDQDILGRTSYISPTGIVFTNGLMIKFDSSVSPAKYANSTYVVEGVGRNITLVKFDNLAFPEPGLAEAGQVPWDRIPYASGNWDEPFKGPPTQDYVVCNRGSLDLNAWSRQNRWFHVDVITAAAAYNNTTATFEQATRAQRPIIEFEPSIQLFNNGRVGKSPADIIDTTTTDTFRDLRTRSVDFVNQGLVYTLNFTPDDNDVITVTAGDVLVPPGQYSIFGNILTLSEYQMGFDIRVEANNYRDSIQHSRSLTVNGITFAEGQRVLFAADRDPLVRTQIYLVQYSLQDNSAKASYYDGKGHGQISIEPATINFASISDPVKNLLDTDPTAATRYTWEVIGSPDILTAIEVAGLDYPGAGAVGKITQIDNLGSRHYLIHFTTPYTLIEFNNFDVKLLAPTGNNYVYGINTAFTTDLKVGSAIYDLDGKYLGTVAFIINDTKLRLVADAAEPLINAEFYYRDPRIQLIVSEDPDDVLVDYDSIVSIGGPNKGVTFWYNGTTWIRGQQKRGINQSPKFDVFDMQGKSLSDPAYPSSKFVGTDIFSYTAGSGTADTVLGFPLAYRNFNSIADILFNNNFDLDQFQYLVNGTFVSKNINLGYLRENKSYTDFTPRTAWTTCLEPSKQYQIINTIAAGDANYFAIDILPDTAVDIPTLKVYVNNTLLTSSLYEIVKIGAVNTVHIKSVIVAGDNIDILIFNSKTPSAVGYYQIPDNLNYNSKNVNVTSMSLGQLRNHVTLTGQNALRLTGQLPGASNLRDIDIKFSGGNILQSAAPMIYASLFLISKQVNFINGIDYARREYTKFKNKFLEVAANLAGLNYNDPSSAIDTILETINIAKNPSFPWYISDMVPYGKYVSTHYSVINPRDRQFKIDSIFDISKLQSRAVMIYNGNQLLTHGIDYTFSTNRPSVIINDTIYLITGSVIEIREYNTDGNYIPETPTKLGLYPKFIPKLYTDATYVDPVQVVRGHDGSITPAFGDFRDLFLLELETRIYNNIKINHEQSAMDVRDYIPGRFRSTNYTHNEFNNIIQASLLKWAGTNQVDISSNSYFDSNNPFSYNYKTSTDVIYNQPLPGYWRGIYRYFFDTDQPHSCPWEMLGFTDEPAWWTGVYGPAPYTSENQLLWTDLAAGTIKQGVRAGTYSKYARPNLLLVIPVDEHGNLVPPLGKIVKQFNSGRMGDVFAIGDSGPAETAWQRSSEYPFALQQAVALMNPAVYFATLFDTNVYKKNVLLNQYQMSTTGGRVTPASITIPGEIVNNTVTRTAGYINYISDYLVSLGISAPTKIKTLIDNFDIQLAYRVAGFTDKKYLTALADQFSPTSINESIIIPDRNYQIQLNKSVPTDRVVYSAVIVKKTPSGYTVTGYDTASPYFTIIPSNTNGESYAITVQNISATIYKTYQFSKLTVPYGYEFTSRQQLVDFLVSYQRFLNSQGFIFDQYNQDLGAVQDWVVSAQEFLTWTLQGWKTGSLLILSPCNSKLNLISELSVVDEITNEPLGSKILDPNFAVIKKNNLVILRKAGNFTIQTANAQTIAYAELDLVQFEHVLVFDNTTIFNDVIYLPELGSRQYRIKLVGNKTNDWDGSLSAPGFIYNSTQVDEWRSGKDYLKGDIVSYKNAYYVALTDLVAANKFAVNSWRIIDKSSIRTGLLPNFATNAAKSIAAYDVDNSAVDETTQKFSSSLIGFRSRNYLNDLSVSTASQIKFYQGFIKEKGTKNAINALKNTSFNNLQNNISYFEEWGLRVGEYGAQNSNHTVEIQLSDLWSATTQLGITITDNNYRSTIPGMISIKDKNLYSKPFHNGPVKFLNRDVDTDRGNDIQTAGYVNLDDVDATVFDGSSYDSLKAKLDYINSGYTIWVAKSTNYDWDIYRVNETKNTVVSVAYSLDLSATVSTKNQHGFAIGDTVVVKQFNSNIDGFHTVIDISANSREFTIATTTELSKLLRTAPMTGIGVLMVLHSLRFKSPKYIAGATPLHTWQDGDLTWVDANHQGLWAIYKKQSPWSLTDSVEIKKYQHRANFLYGTSVKINPAGDMMVIGSPGEFNHRGTLHIFNNDTIKKEIPILPITNIDVLGLGQSVDYTNLHIIAGAPNSNNKTGTVVIYSQVGNVYVRAVQYINSPDSTPGANFGFSISASQNGQWLYVGSPGADKVHKYQLQTYEFKTKAFSATPSVTHYTVPYTITNANSIAVYYKDALLELGTDYTVLNNTVILSLNSIYAMDLIPEVTNGFNDFLVVTQRSYYSYASTIQGTTNSGFGYNVKTENTGNMLVVGAPDATADEVLYAGAAFVYKNTGNGPAGNDPELIQELAADYPTYRGRVGVSVEICPNDCSVYVGAPGYSYSGYSGGAVFRFVNAGLVLGQVIGTPLVTILTAGSITINGIILEFAGGSLNDFATAVNSAAILGVTAAVSNGNIVISSSITNTLNRLNIIPVTGNLINQLGILIFQSTQKIVKPLSLSQGDRFGTRLRISPDAETLLISALGGSSVEYASLDSKTTTFDSDSTRFNDYTMGTGVVYSYDYLSSTIADSDPYGTFGFSQEFTAPRLMIGDGFGSGIDFNTNTMLIGSALHDDNFLPRGRNSGEVYRFTNINGDKGWTLLRQQLPSVDVTGITGVHLYDRVKRKTLTQLDYIDPIKGKIFGVADSALDYKSSWDPASYNTGTAINQTLSDDYHWNSAQVGKTWWNLDTARFIDYEQQDLNYRLKNWGKMFPGSTISVYEWISSSVIPSRYSKFNKGTPLYPNDSAYVMINGVDTTTGIITTTYYYWVKGITTVPANSERTLSVLAIENLISDPTAQNIPYAAILSDNSIGLINCQDYISANSTVLQINYEKIMNKNIIHNEFELVQEGNGAISFPSRIINKLVDSLSGADSIGKPVPDISLPRAQQLGLSLRPRQTLVIDKNSAMHNIVQYVNSVFKTTAAAYKLQNSAKYAGAFFFGTDPEPTPATTSSVAYFRVTDGGSGDNFVIKLTDPAKIQNARDQLNNVVPKLSITGLIIKSTVDYNPNYSYHYDPDTIDFFEYAMEVCDATFAYTEDNLADAGGAFLPGLRLCPWNSLLLEEVVESSTYHHRVADLTEREYVVKIPGERTLVANDADFSNLWTLYQVLEDGTWKLIRNQTFKTPDLWEYVNWYKSDFDSETKITHVVEYFRDTEKLVLVAGDVVKVNQSATGGFEIYQFDAGRVATLVAVERGTLKLNDLIWDTNINGVGFDNAAFDTTTFDKDYAQETRNILTGLEKNIFIDDLLGNYNRLMFVAIEYILSEQKSVDWAFKTSFINVLHNIRELQQYPVYIKDNTTYYQQYINEVKPYRTKIREYKLAYNGVDVVNAAASDFDLPAYYDSTLGRFRSPSGEYPAIDGPLYATPDYQDWNNNFLNQIENIVLANKGSGYTVPPKITVIDSAGIGTGVIATATINELLGRVEQITVVKSGQNFRGKPIVIIQGNGTGATAYAVLANHKIRSIKTLLKFDRVTYETDITQWLPDTPYQEGARVSYQSIGYVAKFAVPASNLFNYSIFVEISDSEYTTALDRIAARYKPNKYQVPREFDSNTGIIDTSRVVPNPNLANRVDNTVDVVGDTFMLSPPNYDEVTGLASTDINITGGGMLENTIAGIPEELVPGITFDTLDMTVITNLNSNDPSDTTARAAYRLVKDTNDTTEFYAVSGARKTYLTEALNYNDTVIQVYRVGPLTISGMPTTFFINGEKIVANQFDSLTNQFSGLIRGAGNTPIPLVHEINSQVKSADKSLKIVGVSDYQTTRHIFKKSKHSFTTTFTVEETLDTVKNQFALYIGLNKLTIEHGNSPLGKRKFNLNNTPGDYMLDLAVTGHIIVTFTQSAIDQIANGIPIKAVYTRYTQFQDGTLADSMSSISIFLKNNPYY